MFTIQLTSNIDQVVTALRNKTDAVIDQIRRGMFEGIRLFEGAAIKEFYTGRKGKMGLNVITGTLRRGWLTKSIISQEDFIVQLANKIVYGPTHEFSDYRLAWGRVMAYYPKRTDVTGKWKKEGRDYLNKAVTKKLSRFVKIT